MTIGRRSSITERFAIHFSKRVPTKLRKREKKIRNVKIFSALNLRTVSKFKKPIDLLDKFGS